MKNDSSQRKIENDFLSKKKVASYKPSTEVNLSKTHYNKDKALISITKAKGKLSMALE